MDSVEDLIQQRVRQEIEAQAPTLVAQELNTKYRWTMSKQDLVKATGVSASTIEKFVSRFDVKLIEEWSGHKRLYRYPEIKDLWDNYLKEQYLYHYKNYPKYIKAKEKGKWEF